MYHHASEKKATASPRLPMLLLCISLLCCVFEGAARKWAVGDASIAGRIAYISKDAALACFLLLGSGRANPLTRAVTPFLVCGLLLLGAGAAISAANGVQPLGAVLTIRTFFVLPLAALAAGRLLPRDALRKFALSVALLSVPIAALGTLQFYAPASSPLNRYSTMDEATCVATASVSQRVRATGTFSYITGFADFATLAVWAALVTLTLARTERARCLGYAGLAAGACGAFVTVSRAPVLISVGLVAVWTVAGGKLRRKAQMALAMAAACFLALWLSGRWNEAEEVASTVYLRHESARGETLAYRLWYQFIDPLDAADMAPLGEGLGSQQVAGSLNTKARRFRSTIESFWGRTILELGVIGLAGFLASCGAVLAALCAAYLRSPRGEARTVLAVTAATLGARLLAGIQYDHVAAYFFWAVSATTLASCGAAVPARKGRKLRRSAAFAVANVIRKCSDGSRLQSATHEIPLRTSFNNRCFPS